MSSALHVVVQPPHSGRRVDQILAALVSGLSRNEARRLIERGGVRANGSALHGAGQRLPDSTVLDVDPARLEDRPAPTLELLAQKRADILLLARGPQWAVLRKPAGLGATPHHFGDALCFCRMGRELIAASDPSWRAHEVVDDGLVHRLDHGTSGVSLFARDADTLATFIDARRRGLLQRTYWALVAGSCEKKGQITYPIAHHPSDPTRMVALVHGNEPHRGEPQLARSTYRRLATDGGTSLLELDLDGGRRHQLRVHLAAIGHPILGDDVYGPGSGPRLALHALRIRFLGPESQQEQRVVADPGEHFWAFSRGLGGAAGTA